MLVFHVSKDLKLGCGRSLVVSENAAHLDHGQGPVQILQVRLLHLRELRVPVVEAEPQIGHLRQQGVERKRPLQILVGHAFDLAAALRIITPCPRRARFTAGGPRPCCCCLQLQHLGHDSHVQRSPVVAESLPTYRC